jgi:two-component sensor histidine kinase
LAIILPFLKKVAFDIRSEARKKSLALKFIQIVGLGLVVSFAPDIYYQNWFNLIFLLAALLLLLLLRFFIQKNYLNLPITVLAVFINCTIFYFSAVQGKAAGNHYFFIPVILGIPFIYSLKSKGLVIFNIAFTLALLALLEISAFDWFEDQQPGAAVTRIYEAVNLIIVLGVLIFFIFQILHNQEMAKSKSRELQLALQDKIDLKNTLIKEIHHRTKNNMQLISSLLNIQKSTTKNEELKNFIHDTNHRIQAISRIHNQLLDSGTENTIELGQYLMALSTDMVNSYVGDPERFSLELKADHCILDTKKVTLIGLMVNEILSNALKHAYPETQKGKIYVHLSKHEAFIQLNTGDYGKGLMDDCEPKGSWGIRLIQTFARDLNAVMEMKNEQGVHFSIQIPIESVG